MFPSFPVVPVSPVPLPSHPPNSVQCIIDRTVPSPTVQCPGRQNGPSPPSGLSEMGNLGRYKIRGRNVPLSYLTKLLFTLRLLFSTVLFFIFLLLRAILNKLYYFPQNYFIFKNPKILTTLDRANPPFSLSQPYPNTEFTLRCFFSSI